MAPTIVDADSPATTGLFIVVDKSSGPGRAVTARSARYGSTEVRRAGFHLEALPLNLGAQTFVELTLRFPRVDENASSLALEVVETIGGRAEKLTPSPVSITNE